MQCFLSHLFVLYDVRDLFAVFSNYNFLLFGDNVKPYKDIYNCHYHFAYSLKTKKCFFNIFFILETCLLYNSSTDPSIIYIPRTKRTHSKDIIIKYVTFKLFHYITYHVKIHTGLLITVTVNKIK